MTEMILTIAGSDTLAGGGLQADLKAFEAHGLFGVTAITCFATCVSETFEIHDVPLDILQQQLATIKNKLDLSAIKIGLIHQVAALELVADFLSDFSGPIVVDPVLTFKESDQGYNETYKTELVAKLFPLATIVTPNLREAEILAGFPINNMMDLQRAAKKIYKSGPQSVIIKGGERLAGTLAADLFYAGEDFTLLEKPKLLAKTVNGAGCTFASAIASQLVFDPALLRAVKKSKDFVYQGIQQGIVLKNGDGNVWYQGENKI